MAAREGEVVVRLKGGYVIECTGCEKDADGTITKVLVTDGQAVEYGQPLFVIE